MAKDDKSTTLDEARALFSAPPKLLLEPTRQRDGNVFEYLPETVSWIPPGYALIVEGGKLDEHAVATVREFIESEEERFKERGGFILEATDGTTFVLPKSVKARLVKLPILLDSADQKPSIFGGIDWGADSPLATVSVWKFPVEERVLDKEFPVNDPSNEITRKESLLRELRSELEKQLATDEIVGYGDPVIEMDRDIFRQRYVAQARIKVAVPPKDGSFELNGDDLEKQVIKEYTRGSTSEVLRNNPNSSVIAVSKPASLGNACITKEEIARRKAGLGDFNTQWQQIPPEHPHCRSRIAGTSAGRYPRIGETWTDGGTCVWVTRINCVFPQQNKSTIRVKHTRGGAEYEETLPLDQFMDGWWPTDELKPIPETNKPFPRSESRWQDEYGAKIIVEKVLRCKYPGNVMIHFTCVKGAVHNNRLCLVDFWKEFDPCQ